MKFKNNFLLTLLLFLFELNMLNSQNQAKFDSIRVRFIYNYIVNHYLCGHDLISLAYSGMQYDTKRNYVSILDKRITDKETIEYLYRQFELDSSGIQSRIQGKFNSLSLISQFNTKQFTGNATEIKQEMLNDTNCVVSFQFSDFYRLKEKFIVFVRINNLFIDTIVTYYYMYEFQYCPQSDLYEFLNWMEAGGFNFEKDKVIYINLFNEFKDRVLLCDDWSK
jgi:hypothetical protein